MKYEQQVRHYYEEGDEAMANETAATHDHNGKPYATNPWHPETRLLVLALFGKLGEELGEATAIVLRCIIQGIDEAEPVTKKPNRDALENELADVLATIDLVVEHFKLDGARMGRRVVAKKEHLRAWHEKISPTTPSWIDLRGLKDVL